MKICKTAINFSFLFILLIFTSTLANSKSAPSSFADLADKVMPSVVNISTTQTVTTSSNPFPFKFPPGSPFEDMFKEFNQPQERQATSLGSGFIIDKSGVVVTNNHVVQGAEDIVVRVNGKEEYKAKILGTDPYADLAVLRIESDEIFTPVNFGDSDKARVGDWVVAIGNPYGLGGTVTSGIISAKHRDVNMTRYDDFIQTDASINVGNSGGPLFDLNGKVIGVNTAIIAPGSSGSVGIGFAIPSNSATKVIDQLIEFGETRRGWLGVRIQEVTNEIADSLNLKEAEGALVANVSDDSPAYKGGIKPGDVILEFDGKKVPTMKSLPKLVAQTKVGKRVKVKIWRNQKIISKTVLVGRLETTKEFLAEKNIKTDESDSNKLDKLKISVRNLNKDDILTRELPKNISGVVITKINDDSPLNFVSVDDIIVEVQKKKIKNVDHFEKLINETLKEGNKTLLFAIYDKRNQRSYLTVKLE